MDICLFPPSLSRGIYFHDYQRQVFHNYRFALMAHGATQTTYHDAILPHDLRWVTGVSGEASGENEEKRKEPGTNTLPGLQKPEL